MIAKKEARSFVYVVKGVRRKTLAVGDKGLMSQFLLEEGAVLPLHSHCHEQIGYLQSGEIVLIIGEEEHLLQAGDSWAIPADMHHAARAVKDAVALEVFIPVRQDYLD